MHEAREKLSHGRQMPIYIAAAPDSPAWLANPTAIAVHGLGYLKLGLDLPIRRARLQFEHYLPQYRFNRFRVVSKSMQPLIPVRGLRRSCPKTAMNCSLSAGFLCTSTSFASVELTRSTELRWKPMSHPEAKQKTDPKTGEPCGQRREGGSIRFQFRSPRAGLGLRHDELDPGLCSHFTGAARRDCRQPQHLHRKHLPSN
jgi:hypothetical protein